jgi:hypothetical protein
MKPFLTLKLFSFKDSLVNYLTLFSSLSTLLCCALPALLVSLGLGSVMMGLATNVPGLVWISENKEPVFFVAFLLLSLNGYLLWRARIQSCPIDPKLRDACLNARRASKAIYFLSVGAFVLGTFYAYLAPILFVS